MQNKLSTQQENTNVTGTVEKIPSLVFSSTMDEKTGKSSFDMHLSDGSKPCFSDPVQLQAYKNKLDKSLERTTGTTDSEIGVRILGKVVEGSKHKDAENQFNNAASMLYALKPQDETEALLIGQFLNLQDSGNAFLRRAHHQEGFYHLERFSLLAVKMFNTANQTMQALLKYRSRGQQVVQVVHLHNDGGQAIVAQNLSKNYPRGGVHEKNNE